MRELAGRENYRLLGNPELKENRELLIYFCNFKEFFWKAGFFRSSELTDLPLQSFTGGG